MLRLNIRWLGIGLKFGCWVVSLVCYACITINVLNRQLTFVRFLYFERYC